jgi:hypothetical protein
MFGCVFRQIFGLSFAWDKFKESDFIGTRAMVVSPLSRNVNNPMRYREEKSYDARGGVLNQNFFSSIVPITNTRSRALRQQHCSATNRKIGADSPGYVESFGTNLFQSVHRGILADFQYCSADAFGSGSYNLIGSGKPRQIGTSLLKLAGGTRVGRKRTSLFNDR